MPKIHAFGSQAHYADHLKSVWTRLGEFQGDFWSCYSGEPEARIISLKPTEFVPWVKSRDKNGWWLVASFSDLTMLHSAGLKNLILMEHGIGQTYQGIKHGSYIGAARDFYCRAYWMPNNIAAKLQASYTKKPVYTLPACRIEDLRKIVKNPYRVPVVVFSFHSTPHGIAEQKGTFPEWKEAVAELAKREDLQVIGHGHPFTHTEAGSNWNKLGIPFVPTLKEVVSMADVYCCDNSSTQYETATCGIPQIVLNGSRYRPLIQHGLRFWEFSDVGLNVWGADPERAAKLISAIDRTLSEDPRKSRREEIVAELFGHMGNVESIARETMAHFGVLKTFTPVQVDLQKIDQETPAEEENMEIFAEATKTATLTIEGLILEGQVFKPGFLHEQSGGQAVPVKQISEKPHLRLSVLRASGRAVPVYGGPPVIPPEPAEVPDVEIVVAEEELPLSRRTIGPISIPQDAPKPEEEVKKRGKSKSRKG